jgi:hypothetical protein
VPIATAQVIIASMVLRLIRAVKMSYCQKGIGTQPHRALSVRRRRGAKKA